MKRLIMIILVIGLVCSFAYAENYDYSSMSVQELKDIIQSARNELLKKTAQEDGKVFLLDEDGVQVYLTGKCVEDTFWGGYSLEIIVINNTGEEINWGVHDIFINGWEVTDTYNLLDDIKPGKKKKDGINLYIKDADITTLEEIEDVEMTLFTYNPETSTMKNYDPVVVFYDGENWSK